MPSTLAWLPGHWEWIIILVIALLVFGRRLPEVGRSLGRGLVEFKKGLKGFKDEFESVDQDVRSAGEEGEGSDSRRLESREDPSAASPSSAQPTDRVEEARS
jgi:TatA/E family protein of Tat protein translocase